MMRVAICVAAMTLVGCGAYTSEGTSRITSSDLLEAPAGRCVDVGTRFTSQGGAVPIRQWQSDDPVKIAKSVYEKYMYRYIKEKEECR